MCDVKKKLISVYLLLVFIKSNYIMELDRLNIKMCQVFDQC